MILLYFELLWKSTTFDAIIPLMKIGAIIQARTGSTRLPAKVLKDLPYGSGISVLQHVISRVRRSKLIDDIVVATTRLSEDDAIAEIAGREDVKCYRGSVEDVLERYYFASKENGLDIVVRITGDCPCIDWNIVDNAINLHLKEKADYTSNTLRRTFPYGLDVEVVSFEALEKAYFEAREKYDREHVCPYIYKTKAESFKISLLTAPPELNYPDIRVTLDTKEDYTLLCAVFDYLYPDKPYFDSSELVALFIKKPWLKFINERVLQKRVFSCLEEELEEAKKLLRLQELFNVLRILENLKL